MKEIGDVRFEINFERDRCYRWMYWDAYEVETVQLLKKYLVPKGCFIDVGANVGYLSAVAMSLVGPNGQVHSFEPVREHFERLKQLQIQNPRYSLTINAFALGDKDEKSKISITNRPNIGWNSMVPGGMPAHLTRRVDEIEVHRLDDYLMKHRIQNVGLIKIDVEGFETQVLKGLSRYFEQGNKPLILCEIAPACYPLLGSTLEELSVWMRQWGYRSFNAINDSLEEELSSLRQTTNVLFKSS